MIINGEQRRSPDGKPEPVNTTPVTGRRSSALRPLIALLCGLALWLAPQSLMAQAISNSATGTSGGAALNAAGATVNLNRIVVVGVPDSGRSTVTVNPAVVLADGVTVSTITVTLIDGTGLPVAGKTVTLASDRAGDTIVQPAAPTDASGRTTATIASLTPGVATITATDTTDGIVLTARPQVIFTAGQVLRIRKTVSAEEARIGDAITYQIQIENTIAQNVNDVRIVDQAPPDFKYKKGTVRLDGKSIADPQGHQTLVFTLGTIGPNEKMTLRYAMIVGSGGKVGVEYKNQAVAKESFLVALSSSSALQAMAGGGFGSLSNSDGATVKLVFDPIFDLGTIIGKVFNDKNGNGRQDRDETGIAGAMVALDDGTYAITDSDGRYHFPGVLPGQRLVKINLGSITPEAAVTTDESLVVEVTQGLLAKANFGVIYESDKESIGREGVAGLEMKSEPSAEPIEVIGSTETMTVIINGQPTQLPGAEVRLGVQALAENVEIQGGKLKKPIIFDLEIGSRDQISEWTLTVYDSKGEVFHRIHKEGPPPALLQWNGKGNRNRLVQGGEVYQYVLEVVYTDGSRSESSRRLFGVNRSEAISLNLSGSAFEVGKAELSAEAKKILKESAATLRRYPNEKVVIEGHADATGTEKINLNLSKERALAALNYLVNVEKIPAGRFAVKWYGASRPITGNNSEEGREINRRVEIKGQVKNEERSKILDQLRSQPEVRINEESVPVQPDGRFIGEVSDMDSGLIKIELMNQQGRRVETTIKLPELTILDPAGVKAFQFGEKGDGYSVEKGSDGRTVIRYRIRGITDPENSLMADGKPVLLYEDGTFEVPVDLAVGRNVVGLVVKDPRKSARILNLVIEVSDRDENGRLKMALEPVPFLSVQFPVRGKELTNSNVPISGTTLAGNQISVNGEPVPVQEDGRFTTVIKLPRGKRTPVVVEVRDPEGHTGRLEREIEVKENDFFLLAFADGEVGQLKTKGYLAGANQSKEHDFYSEGRIAYYFKGTVLGKYLVTSAFDTGKREFNRMFTELDRKENDRLLTNLDPDKYYPVYGDSSTVVYDAQSQGRFYLAVDSDEFHLLVGDFPVGLNDTELAAYNRTLYGARAQYRSLSSTSYGAPVTKATVFGAEVRTVNAHNQFRGTGGSLYYLNHDRVIEGSEQVRIEVRDKNTGVILSTISQERNIDYQIKYEEGRLLFTRPIPSVVDSSLSLINNDPLGGNPVYILADFEYATDLFENSAYGGHVRQQIGDHLSVGGTHVNDEQAGANYELNAGDVEVRLGRGTRVLGEYAGSRGSGGEVQYSDDGGLTFTAVNPGISPDGRAYKISIETDVGEAWGRPGLLHLNGYFKELSAGFFSNGTILEQGTKKFGGGATIRPTRYDTFHLRYEGQRLLDNGNSLSQAQIGGLSSDLETAQWIHDQGRFQLTAEFQAKQLETDLLRSKSETAAGRIRYRVTDHLSAYLAQQNSFRGPKSDQTSAGVDYALERITLFSQAATGNMGDSVRGGLSAVVGENGRVTFSQQLSRDSEGQRSSQSVVHGENTLRPGTKVYTEYQLNQSAKSDTEATLAGLSHRWRVTEGLSFNFLAEGTRIDKDGEITTKDALGAGLSFEHPEWLRLYDRAEVRHEHGAEDKVQYVTSNGVEYWLGRDFRLLGRAHASLTRNLTTENTDARYTELSAGMAYRPVAGDRLNGLAKYTLIADRRPESGAGNEKDTLMSVWSAEGALELKYNLQWVDKLAYKIKDERIGTDPSVKTHTVLSIHRLNLHLDRAWDFGLEYRLLRVYEANDQQAGYLVEMTRALDKHFRLGVGYNFTRFSDNEFSDNNYSVMGWFFRFQGKY